MTSLTFNIADLIGNDFDTRRTKVWIEANSDLLVDTDANVMHFGDAKVTIADDGTGSFDGLIATQDVTVKPASGRLYRVWVDYAKRSTGERVQWNSGWFQLTANTDLSDVVTVDVTVIDPVMVASVSQMVADAQAAAASINRGQPNGVAPLDGSAKVPQVNLPAHLDPTTMTAAITASIGKRKAYILPVAGQSNSVGFGQGGDTTWIDVAVPGRIFQYANPANTFTPYPGKVVLALEPLAHRAQPATADLGGIGHALTFARAMLGRIEPDAVICIVPCALSGIGFGQVTNGATWAVTGQPSATIRMYDELVANVNAASAAMTAQGYAPQMMALLWHQGEADRTALTQSTYASNLDALIDGVRTAWSAPTMPIIIGGLLWHTVDYRAGQAAISAAHADSPNRRSNVAFAAGPTGTDIYNTNDVTDPNDPVHYNAKGQRLLATNYVAAWDALQAGTATALTAPAGLSGITVAATRGYSVDFSWPSVTRAAWYRIESSPHNANTWTIAGYGFGTTGTAYGLDPQTSYDFRITPVNHAGSGTAGTTTATTATAVGVVNQIGLSAYQAYSLRRLRDAYTGAAVRVRRSSDNVELDIPLLSNGKLDTATLLTHVGSGSGYVSKWYDQSGNARDMTVTTTTRQPMIVNAGALVTVNGRMGVSFNGTNILKHAAPGGYASASGATYLSVLTNPTVAASATPYSEDNNTSTSPRAQYNVGRFVSTGQRRYEITNDAGTTISAQQAAETMNGTIHVYSDIDTTTTVASWRDGSVALAPTAYTRSGAVTINTAALGGIPTGTSDAMTLGYTGTLSELVMFTTALTDTQRQTGEKDMKGYFGTP